MVVYVCKNDLGFSRLGVVVSKRVGKAVERNRVRRLVREAFRLSGDGLPVGYDVICVCRKAAGVTLEGCAASLGRLAAGAAKRWERREKRDGDQAT